MQFWSSVRQHLAFTRQETLAIAFLTVALLIGEAVRLYRRGVAPERPAMEYGALDSAFFALSRAGHGGQEEGTETPSRLPADTRLSPGSVNINTATLEQLTALPGIGPVTAEKILAFRIENGPFETAEDLLAVRGIGPKKLARIRAYLRVE